jgi:hypothetical protein
MIRDDFDQVDIDVPIPYVLTKLALRELAQLRDEEANQCPAHEWKFEPRGAVCQNCGRCAEVGGGQSVPSYLHPKGRRSE